jgi:tetratricopeptide (TPR) repeat protein
VGRTIRWLGKWSLAAVAVAACCAGGVALSTWLRPAVPAAKPDADTAQDAPATEPIANEEPAPELTNESSRARLDRMVLDGRYADALTTANRLREKTEGAARDALDYRVGLCLELRGRTDEAFDAYGTLASHSPDSAAGAAAAAGQARISLRAGKFDRARQQLAALLLRSSRPPLRGHPALGDVPHLLALVLTREACPAETPNPSNSAAAHPAIEVAVAPMLAAVKWDAPAAPADAAAAPVTVQKNGTKPDSYTVSAIARQSVALDFLNDLAEKAGLKAQWSPEARKQAGAATLIVAADKLPLGELLRAATAVANLGWELMDGKLIFSVFPAGPVPARLAAARRALIEAATANPEHPLAAVVAVELGNLEVAAGRLQEGAGWYERLIRERPRVPAAVEAYFNLGLVDAKSGERGPARDAFYRAVDRNPTGPLAGLAYLHIGRLYLEEGNPTLAARALRRVTSGAATPLMRTSAALLTAAAELLDDNPRAAHAAIAAAGPGVGEEPYVHSAALLDALCRFRASADPDRRERAASDLLAALLAYHEEPLLGAVGLVLAGQAYRDLSLGDEMAGLYQKAASGVGPALAMSMKADTAEHLMASGKKGAVKLLREVAAASGPRGIRAELQLAEMDLKQKRTDECLTRCRKVLSGGDAATCGEAARLMGQAYTLKGDHASAARCFAGKPPTEEGTTAAATP